MASLRLAALLAIGSLCVTTDVLAQSVTITWSPSLDVARVIEYRVYRNGILQGGTAELKWQFPIAPAETIVVAVSSYGWTADWQGTKEGPLSEMIFYTAPADVSSPLAPQPPSPDGAACQAGTGCALVDGGSNVWTIDAGWPILRNGQHWNGGYSDWLLWFGGRIYAYRSDTNGWWVDTASGWAWVGSDPRDLASADGAPRDPASADGAACQAGTGCSLVDGNSNVWTIDVGRTILRNGQHWNGGYSDWLMWFAGNMYAYRSDTDGWWVDTATGWMSLRHDPRTVPVE